MGKSAGDKLSSAGGAAALGGLGLAVGGVPGALFGAAKGAEFGASFDPKNPLGKDPTGAKAAEKKRNSLLEELKKAEVTTTGESSSVTDTTGTSRQESQMMFDPKSAQEQALLDQSLSNLSQQQNLVTQQEAGIAGREGLQTGARDTLGGVLSGEAFQTTDLERGRIDAVRQADLDIGSRQIGGFLDERLAQLQADAAQRGVRGQAFSQLQGDVVGEAASSLESRVLEANKQAAQSEIDITGQRVGQQAGIAGGLADFSDQARQQAIANREGLRNPAELAAMRDERLKGGKQVTTGSNTSRSNTTGTSSSTQVGGGFAGAATQFAGMPTSQQSGLATGIQVANLGVKGLAAGKGA